VKSNHPTVHCIEMSFVGVCNNAQQRVECEPSYSPS
jgi:hypothetical protein